MKYLFPWGVAPSMSCSYLCQVTVGWKLPLRMA